jgi:hypothetical protein
VQDLPRLALLDLLDAEKATKRIEHVEYEGEQCVLVECAWSDSLCVRAWLSPHHGYLVKRSITYWGKPEDKTSHFDIEVPSMKEYEKGIFFPERTITKYFPENAHPKPFEVTTIKFEEVRINAPIKESELRTTIPAGTSTIDHDQRTMYTMGKDGKPSPDHPVLPLPTAAIHEQPASHPTASSSKFWWYVSGAFLACLFLGYRFFTWRRTGAIKPMDGSPRPK